MSEIELKSCPFCGEEGAICSAYWDFENNKPQEGSPFVVECTECLARTDKFETQEQAAEAWNRRADDAIP